jgi:thioredoxin-like negative regulator of GroEL
MLFITQEQELISSDKSQVLYFYAPWMPYHKKMLIMIDKMEQKYKELIFYAIDADHFKGLCRRFSIDSVPTVLIMNNGAEAKRITGLVLTSAFKSAFADICNS